MDAPMELGDILSGSMGIRNEYSGATLLENSKYLSPSLLKPASWPLQPFHGKSSQDFQPLAASAQAGFCCAPEGGEVRRMELPRQLINVCFPTAQFTDFHFQPPDSPKGTTLLAGTLAQDPGSF